MKKFVERFRGAQRGSDVLEESRLRRARLIDRSFPPASGGDSCMIWMLGVPRYYLQDWGTSLSPRSLFGFPVFCLPFLRL